MRCFPSAAHLASWAGMCPGSYESAGKRKGGKTRKGNTWLRRALIEAACAAARNKRTYLAARFRRLLVRRGKKKAAVAVGHTSLTIVYALLLHGDTYQDLTQPAWTTDSGRGSSDAPSTSSALSATRSAWSPRHPPPDPAFSNQAL